MKLAQTTRYACQERRSILILSLNSIRKGSGFADILEQQCQCRLVVGQQARHEAVERSYSAEEP